MQQPCLVQINKKDQRIYNMDLVELLDHRGIEYRKTNNPTEILIAYQW